MKARKLVILIAALGVLALLLVACGNNNNADPPTTTAPTAAPTTTGPTETTAPPTTTEPAPVQPEFPDLDGRVVRFGSQAMYWFTSIGSFNEDGWVTPVDDNPNYFVHRLRYENRQRVEELFNIVIEPVLIPGGEIIGRLGTANLAGEAYVDIIYMGPAHVNTAFSRGYVMPINDLGRPDSNWRTTQTHMWPGLTVDGDILGLVRPLPVMNQQGIFVNLDVINAFGAPNPVDLFDRGEWTWDAMRDIMAMTTSGDYFGVSGALGQAMMHFIVANDAYIVNPVTLEIGHDNPAALAAMEFFQEILANGWFMVADYEADNYLVAGANSPSFNQGRSALHFVPGVATINAERNAAGGTLPMNFDWVPHPVGPNNTSGVTYQNNGRNNESIIVGAEDPEILLWILEELFMWPGYDYYVEHEADHDWARAWAPNEALVSRLVNNGTNMAADLGPLTGVVGAGFHNNLLLALYNNEMTIAQYIEYHRQDRNHALRVWFGLE